MVLRDNILLAFGGHFRITRESGRRAGDDVVFEAPM